jgi:hypothetical protein
MSPATAHRPRTSTKSQVHRDLHLVSPVLRGPDVHVLQQQLNALCDHYEFDWHHILPDGEYGKRSAHQAAFCMELMGLEQELAKKARHSGYVSEHTQQILRNPEKRSADDRRREEERRPRFRELRKKHKEGLEAAIQFMLSKKGTNEQPADSNHGPNPIDECQAYFGLSGVPWCGCLVGYAIEKIGGVGKTGTWWPHAAYIKGDAIAGRNGLIDINPAQIHRGCVVTFFNGDDDHVTLALGDVSGGVFHTVEGNTSSAFRDSDGGIVEEKVRSVNEVTCATHLTIAA